MAFFRALESLHPPAHRLLSDPFATAFLRPSLRRTVRIAAASPLRFLIECYVDARLPGARTSAIARTRLIDDAWSAAVRDGIRQIVILGAGFDSRAYRILASGAATIFEVDHPAMQAMKKSVLLRQLPECPANLRFAAIDFNRQSLPEVLTAAGFERTAPALFLWEGVTNYLTEEAVDGVLSYVGGCASGTRIVFTYVHRGALDGSAAFFGAPKIVADVARIGEPWTFGFDPAEVGWYLRERSLELDADAGAAKYRRQVFGERGTGMKGYEFYYLVQAHVTG
jgi:methyltransferase (TIGR00027 family)